MAQTTVLVAEAALSAWNKLDYTEFNLNGKNSAGKQIVGEIPPRGGQCALFNFMRAHVSRSTECIQVVVIA